MAVFICWEKDNEEDPGDVSAGSSPHAIIETYADDAAAEYAEHLYSDEGFSETEVCVRKPDGTVATYDIRVDFDPTFYACVKEG